ncbi:MAG: hypothetical protein FWB83_07540 [Treponema sp.]|nr:hypothetical protein [Treponema sp.]
MIFKCLNLFTCDLSRRNIIVLAALSVFAVIMNLLFSVFIMNFLRFPLFLDTVFSAAIAFAFGIIPGVFTAFLTWLLPCVYYGSYSFYILCSIAEVLLVCALKPAVPDIPNFSSREKIIASYTALVSKLFLLYILCVMTISVLGGVVDYITHLFFERHYFGVDDLFKPGLIMYNLPALAVNILSRIPVNIVDRFIVIFGGYIISRGLLKLIRQPENGV